MSRQQPSGLTKLLRNIPWVLAGFCLLTCELAYAASFDCGKAKTEVEKLICGNAELSKLDEDLAAVYRTVLQDEQQAEPIRRAQKQWMKERNGCADSDCVRRAYVARLERLAGSGASASVSGQSGTDTPTVTQGEDATCIAPRIDWRNYEWMLITGNDLAICREMLAHLKFRPRDVPPPTCPEERLPPNGNWTRPETRILSEEEREVLLRGIPERWKGKPGYYDSSIKATKVLRVIRGDITRDGIPESLLAYGGREDDYRQTCERSKRCVRPEEIFRKGIVLSSDSYKLLPMNDEGTQVDWSHGTVGAASTPSGGELVFYKGRPYWMTGISWYQDAHDDFTHTLLRADDPYSKIFELAEIWVGTGDNPPHFKNARMITMQYDPESNDVCRFGYFHRDNLKKHPPKRRR